MRKAIARAWRQADKLEALSAIANANSAALSGPRGRYMYALALLQVAISVVSVTLLTRQRWLFGVAIVLSVVGLVTAGVAYLGIQIGRAHV